MATRPIRIVTVGMLSLLIPITLIAQSQRDVASLTNWAAPLYWQPTLQEAQAAKENFASVANATTPEATLPVNSLDVVRSRPSRRHIRSTLQSCRRDLWISSPCRRHRLRFRRHSRR